MDVFHQTLVKFPVVRNIQTFSFFFTFLSSQTTSEDDFSGDEWLGFKFLGVMEAR